MGIPASSKACSHAASSVPSIHALITHLWMSPAAENPEAQQFTKTSILVTNVGHNTVASGHIEIQIFSVST